MVALVMKVTSLEEQQSSNGEPYLVVRGPDMDSNSAHSLRLWRYRQNDMRTDSVYIIRGLKVVPDMYWCQTEWKYVPYTDGRKKLDCSYRTSVEDVSHVEDLPFFF